MKAKAVVKMNKTYKEKWIKALRSGKYKQGKEQLYDPDTNTYCCLGVLQKEVTGEATTDAYLNQKTLSECGLVPSVQKNLSLCNDGETFKREFRSMNIIPPKGRTFQHIADWIEKNL